jgi:hypothetical protein
MTKLDLKAAFFHVIDPHRWLAASGCAWNMVGPTASNETKDTLEKLLPNSVVMIRDCFLLHARSLIKFYRNVRRHDTDIILSDFGVPPIGPLVNQALKDFENPIEVHLFHLTAWRDSDYRKSNAKKHRPNWDTDIPLIVKLVFDALKDVSDQGGDWQQPFRHLHDASTKRYSDKSYRWPTDLGEKGDVQQYLKGAVQCEVRNG